MSEMLTLIKTRLFFCHKLHVGCPVWFAHAMYIYICIHIKKKGGKKTSASKDEFKEKKKHKKKYCPYHLWTNFSIMSLEDERGRGELNVKGDKGIKNRFSTRQSANHSKYEHTMQQLIQSTRQSVDSSFVHEYGFCRFERGEVGIKAACLHQRGWKRDALIGQSVINIQCSHSTIKEHLALLAKNFTEDCTGCCIRYTNI